MSMVGIRNLMMGANVPKMQETDSSIKAMKDFQDFKRQLKEIDPDICAEVAKLPIGEAYEIIAKKYGMEAARFWAMSDMDLAELILVMARAFADKKPFKLKDKPEMKKIIAADDVPVNIIGMKVLLLAESDVGLSVISAHDGEICFVPTDCLGGLNERRRAMFLAD